MKGRAARGLVCPLAIINDRGGQGFYGTLQQRYHRTVPWYPLMPVTGEKV